MASANGKSEEYDERTEWLNSYKIAHPKKRAFLAVLAELGTITHAARAAKIARHTHYDWWEEANGKGELKPETLEYRRAYDDAMTQATENLEREAMRRAVEGVDKPIIRKGFIVGTYKEYSDTLLIFLLKGAKPEKYKERGAIEHTGKVSLEEMISSAWKLVPKSETA